MIEVTTMDLLAKIGALTIEVEHVRGLNESQSARIVELEEAAEQMLSDLNSESPERLRVENEHPDGSSEDQHRDDRE